MNNAPLENFEIRLRSAAARFEYPQTPDIASALFQPTSRQMAARRRQNLRPALVFVIVVLALVTALLSVPSVRAAVIEFFQIGAIRIFTVPYTPTAVITNTPEARPAAGAIVTPTATPVYLSLLLDLEGQTTLEEAQRQARFPLKLPGYPEDLGEPDHVYVQDQGEPAVIFVWSDPNAPESVRLSLFQISPGAWTGEKWAPSRFESTTVNDREALWAEGPYPLILKNRELELRRIVPGSALIWEQDGVTYRLEGAGTLDEAVKIAESLAVIP